jgi:hypothetical protein
VIAIVRLDVTKSAVNSLGGCRGGGAVTASRKKRLLRSDFWFGCVPEFRLMRQYHAPCKVMNIRTLKIETVGDFCHGKGSPQIRLSGRWLERAGFKPGHRVEVQIGQPGILTLRFLASDPGQ